MMSAISALFLLLAVHQCVALHKVTLHKRPLTPQMLQASQKQYVQLAQSYLSASNPGEDIPLLDYLDAQVDKQAPLLADSYAGHRSL